MPPSFSNTLRAFGPNGNLGELFGHVRNIDFPIPPFGLQPLFHVRMDTVRPTSGGVAQPGILINAGNNTVINQEPVFGTHQPIAAFTDGQIAHHIGVHHIQEFACIRPLTTNLPKVDASSRPKDLRVCSISRSTACTRVLIRGDSNRHGANDPRVRNRPRFHRAIPAWVFDAAVGTPRPAQRPQWPHRNRCIGRTEGCCPHIWNICIQCISKVAKPLIFDNLP